MQQLIKEPKICFEAQESPKARAPHSKKKRISRVRMAGVMARGLGLHVVCPRIRLLNRTHVKQLKATMNSDPKGKVPTHQASAAQTLRFAVPCYTNGHNS